MFTIEEESQGSRNYVERSTKEYARTLSEMAVVFSVDSYGGS